MSQVSITTLAKTQSSPPLRWRTLNYPDLLREQWEDEWFLFNPASGNTHVLNLLAIDILERLSLRSSTFAELARNLIDAYQPDRPREFTAHLQRHFQHLDELGLITPEDP